MNERNYDGAIIFLTLMITLIFCIFAAMATPNGRVVWKVLTGQ